MSYKITKLWSVEVGHLNGGQSRLSSTFVPVTGIGPNDLRPLSLERAIYTRAKQQVFLPQVTLLSTLCGIPLLGAEDV